MTSDSLAAQISEFFRKVYVGTQNGLIDWGETANPKVLLAPVGEQYSLTIEEVSIMPAEYVVRLLEGQKVVARVDSRELANMKDPAGALRGLWTMAKNQAGNIDQHLSAVSRLLEDKLKAASRRV